MMTALSIVFLFGLAQGAREVYNIAHMTNTPTAVEWAVQQGANGVEADLSFNPVTGKPSKFYHGSPCDCTCMWSLFFPNSVCTQLKKTSNPCKTEVSVKDLLTVMARKSELAVVVIDSKISKNMPIMKMKIAGQAVVNAVMKYLYGNGYGGQVVIGSSYTQTLPYLRAAVEAASKTRYRHRFYYALDMLDIGESLKELHKLPTKNFVYGTGASACSPSSLDLTTLKLAKLNTAKGTVGMTYIWTVDKKSTIKKNLPYVNAAMSNYPGIVRNVIRESGLKLATQRSRIPSATSSDVISVLP